MFKNPKDLFNRENTGDLDFIIFVIRACLEFRNSDLGFSFL